MKRIPAHFGLGCMPIATNPVRFGTFELDLRAGELRKDGAKIRLQEQPLQVLAMLLEHPGEVVTREELQRKLWPGDTFVDFEHSLNAAVKRLREALGDSADNPRFIETLPRHGYRFIAPLQGTSRKESKARKPAAIVPRWVLLAAGNLVLLLVALTSYHVWRLLHKTALPERRVMLAVLPFENLSGDPSQEFFSDGVTEEMINGLARLDEQRLGVIAATSTMQYKHTAKKISQIGDELAVDYILEGSVRQESNRVRITAQLIAVENQAHVWADSYERDRGEILLTQTDVARAVAQQIGLTLSPEAQQHLGGARRINPEAYSDYLNGRFQEGALTAEGIAKGQAYFEQALRKDPNFALAYLGLAHCYGDYLITRRLPPREAAERTKENIARALQLDQSLGEAYALLGYVNWRYDWDLLAAEQHFRRASELSPNSRLSHGVLIIYLAWRGRREEAFAEQAKARVLDPVSWEDADGIIYYHLRDYSPMIEVSRKYVASNPVDWVGRYLLAVAYQGSGQLPRAIPEYQRAVELSSNDSDPTAALAYAYARIGRKAEAEKILHDLERQSRTGYVSPYMVATIYAGLGDKNSAFEFLEKAYQERSSDLSYFLKADLRMDTLRSDPRFQRLVNRMGFPQ